MRTGPGCWNTGFGDQTWGGDWCWLEGSSLRGRERENPQPGTLVEETHTAIEVTRHCRVMRKGRGRHCCLSPQPHWPLAPRALGSSLHRASSLAPAAADCLPPLPEPVLNVAGAPASPGATTSSPAPCPCCGGHSHDSSCRHLRAPPHQGGLVCSGAASGADPCG